MQVKLPWLLQTTKLFLLSKIYLTKNKEQTPLPPGTLTTVAFINKTRSDPIQHEIIEEKIKWLTKNGTLIKKPFNRNAFCDLSEKDIASPEKISKKFKH